MQRQPLGGYSESMASANSRELLIRSIRIGNYRMFADLQIPRFGLINLLVGRNNTGKSSILEAVSLLATNGSPRVLAEILTRRERNMDRDFYGAMPPVSCLFRRGSPPRGFALSDTQNFLEVREALFRWTGEAGDPERRLWELRTDDDSEGAELRIELKSPRGVRVIQPEHASFVATHQNDPGSPPCVFVATGGLTTSELAVHWSGIAATRLEDRINEQMHACFPDSLALWLRPPATCLLWRARTTATS